MTRHEIALKKLSEGIVIPATPLVLDENRKLDEKGMALLMNYYMDAGAGGIATAVHTTQFEIREAKYGLFEPVIKCVSEIIDKYEKKTGKVIVKIHDLTEDEMIDRTKAVAEVLPVIGFYLQPLAGGRIFTYNYWERLCAIDNVVAIKCAAFNRYHTLDVVRAAALSPRSDKITLYTGNDDNIVLDLVSKYKFKKDGKVYEKSFEGGLLGHWVVWTKKVCEMFEKIKAEKKNDSISYDILSLANDVTAINAIFFDAAHGLENGTIALHEVLRRQGLMKHIHLLDESVFLRDDQVLEIDRAWEMYPELCDDEFVKANLAAWKKEAGIED